MWSENNPEGHLVKSNYRKAAVLNVCLIVKVKAFPHVQYGLGQTVVFLNH